MTQRAPLQPQQLPPGTVPRLLLSARTRDAAANAIAAAAGGLPLEVLTLEHAAADDTATVHAAFISRDITGLSTKTDVLRDLAACYAVLRRSPQLAWVHTHSAGADRPIYPELRAHGVAVTTSSGANAQVVAQTALAGLLGLSRRFPQLVRAQHEHRWAPLVAGPMPPDLAGQTVVLLGWGPIAQTLQPLLALLGLQVVVVRHGGAPAGPGIETVPHALLHTVLPRADWLLLACPLTDSTRGCIDAAALALLPPGAHLVNVARGEVVVEAALVAALQQGRLAGAYLDVFEQEPLPATSALWDLPGVLLTPHAAGHAGGNAARASAIFTDNLARWLRGQPLHNAVP
jgi:phosphoglycerate dehydrogenase-like enzyme